MSLERLRYYGPAGDDTTPRTVSTQAVTYQAHFGQHVPVNTTTAPATITLPTGNKVGEVAVRLSAGSNTVTVDGYGSETVDGQPSAVMTLSGESRVFACDGMGHWFTVSSSPSETALRALIQSELHADTDLYWPLVYNVNTVASSGSAQTIPDLYTYQSHDITLTANCTFTFPPVSTGRHFRIVLRQDAVGGHSVTWPANARKPTGAFNLTTTANATDSIMCFSVRPTAWGIVLEGKNYDLSI